MLCWQWSAGRWLCIGAYDRPASGSNEAGVDKYVIQGGLTHADPEMKTTDVYIRRDWEPIDRANRQILDYVGIEDVILSR